MKKLDIIFIMVRNILTLCRWKRLEITSLKEPSSCTETEPGRVEIKKTTAVRTTVATPRRLTLLLLARAALLATSTVSREAVMTIRFATAKVAASGIFFQISLLN